MNLIFIDIKDHLAPHEATLTHFITKGRKLNLLKTLEVNCRTKDPDSLILNVQIDINNCSTQLKHTVVVNCCIFTQIMPKQAKL